MTATPISHTEGTADRIRATSAVLFAERGFAATSVRDIAAAVGVAPGAIYNHFESKEAILNAIALEGHLGLVDVLERVSRYRHATPTARLESLVDALTLFCIEHPFSTQVFEPDYGQLSGPNRERILELRRTTLSIFEKTLRAGVRAGEFTLPSGHPKAARLLSRTIVNMLVGMAQPFHELAPSEPTELMAFYREVARRLARAGTAAEALRPPLSTAR
jgi:AcrR family transcriptional regulator